MNYSFEFEPLKQTPDSTQSQSGQSFMQQNEQGFMGQQTSIMSSEFQNNTVDSLVKAKTRRLRVRKKKVIKAYKYLDSYLIVKKDSFPFLKNIKTSTFSTFDGNNYIVNTAPQYTSTDSLIIEVKEVPDTALNNEDTDTSYFFETKELIEEKEPVQEESYLVEEPVVEKEVLSREAVSLSGEIWLMAVILGLLFLFAFIKMQFNSKLKTYHQAILSYQSFYKMFKEQNTTNQRVSYLLSTIFYINTSLITFYSLPELSSLLSTESNFVTFSMILLVLFFIILSFNILNKLLAFVLEKSNLINEYLYNIYYYNRVLGLSLLPFVVLYPYIPSFLAEIMLYLAWAAISFSFILRWFRGLQISFKYRVPYFYMFLYLCTLEIIPLIIIIKTILG